MGGTPSCTPLVQGSGLKVLGGRHSFLHSTCPQDMVGFGWEALLLTIHLFRGEGESFGWETPLPALHMSRGKG